MMKWREEMKRIYFLSLILATLSVGAGCSYQPMDQPDHAEVISALNEFYAPFYGKITTELTGKYENLVSIYNFKPIPGTNPPRYDVKGIIFRINGGVSNAKVQQVKGKGTAYIWNASDLPFSKDNPDVVDSFSKVAFIFKKSGRLRPAFFFPRHLKKKEDHREAGIWEGRNSGSGFLKG